MKISPGVEVLQRAMTRLSLTVGDSEQAGGFPLQYIENIRWSGKSTLPKRAGGAGQKQLVFPIHLAVEVFEEAVVPP